MSDTTAPDTFQAGKAIAAIERLSKYDDSVNVADVTAAIEAGTAIVIPNPDGFVVARMDGDDTLFLWLGCSYTGHAPHIAETTENLLVVAQELGLKRIRFGTVRKGWERAAAKLNFTRKGDYFERCVHGIQ